MSRNNSEPNPATKRTRAKENCPPPPTTEPPRRKSRWDVREKTAVQRNSPTLPPTATFRETDSSSPLIGKALEHAIAPVRAPESVPRLATPESQTINVPCPSAPATSSSPPESFETSRQRELLDLEPLHIEIPTSASLAQLSPLDSTIPVMDLDEQQIRAGTCSPMVMSPDCSPTKAILPHSPCGDDGRYSPANPAIEDPFEYLMEYESSMVLESSPWCGTRARRDSLSSDSLHIDMDISPCSSPTKFIFLHAQPPADIPCSPTLRGHTGAFTHTHTRERCPLSCPSVGTHTQPSKTAVAQPSIFWPGQTVVFTFKQPKRSAQPAMRLD
ncbi:hypothetical protein DFH07DRAFT_263578 [Mycena maculata]|uniref:Uncharacterized protein n=1 Tax=Mycena maculata TaxID=230809 RepID=A0AAD7MNR2_9AGAR|nr:hypothetical protein DFH07DRAFT_263578 [Mycena maculata]